jgi:hypothetical protein
LPERISLPISRMPAVFAMGEAHRSMRGVLIEWGALRRATPSSRGMP